MGRQPFLELHDVDSASRSLLELAFVREGWRVVAAGPDNQATLAVLVARGTTENPLSLVPRLGERGIPTIVAGEGALRERALELGASAFLPLPVFARDVVTAGKLIATGADTDHPRAERSDRPNEVRGRIAAFGLYYLLRVVAIMRHSGVLQLRRDNRKGELRFVDGRVVSAQVGPAHGIPAVFQLLLWEQATMTLSFRQVTKRGSLGKSAEELLAECERFLRDFDHTVRDLGSSQTVFIRASADPTLPQDLQPVHKLFDGRRTVQDVVGESPFRVFDTLRVIHRLIEAGAIVRADGTVVALPANRGTGELPSQPWLHDSASQRQPVPDNDPSREQRSIQGDRRKSTRDLAPVSVDEERRQRLANPLPEDELAKQAEAMRPGHRSRASGELRQLTPKTPPPVVPGASTIEIAPELLATGVTVDQPPLGPLNDTVTPPVSARQPSAADARPRSVSGEISCTSRAKPPERLTPTSAFNALEHDFFAREADLYKREKVENFDDLDDPEQQKRKPRRK